VYLVTTADYRAMHRSALVAAGRYVDRLEVGDLVRATPCRGWRLSDLLAHMIGQHRGFARAVQAGSAPVEAYRPVPFEPAVWRHSVDAIVGAFAAADLDDRAVAIELGVAPIVIGRLVAAQLLDTVVHTWDIAETIGAEHVPPPDLLAATATLAAAVPDQARGPQRAFAHRLPRTGDLWSDTLALVGRHLSTSASSLKE
jgi:uncharacterized protein (TIGR03086 family)